MRFIGTGFIPAFW